MKAHARHILVPEEDTCKQLIQEIIDGADFEALAKEHSECPSGSRGGDLGEFAQGMMVPEFDEVVFNTELETGNVHPEPVKTQFGYHVLETLSRSED